MCFLQIIDIRNQNPFALFGDQDQIIGIGDCLEDIQLRSLVILVRQLAVDLCRLEANDITSVEYELVEGEVQVGIVLGAKLDRDLFVPISPDEIRDQHGRQLNVVHVADIGIDLGKSCTDELFHPLVSSLDIQ